eukprot:GEMP01091527.1.p1 GENE.GEMP01091527.1~~GEMP01091527.1.p1  ORF type:complete len:202 (+),score=31.09 GEMP01091527.1:244-849(+)
MPLFRAVLVCFPSVAYSSFFDDLHFPSFLWKNGQVESIESAKEKIEIITVAKDETLPASDECLCDVTKSDSCVCNDHCDDFQQNALCETLLGPCECYREYAAICKCVGWCSTKAKRAATCNDAGGCQWKEFYCGAQYGPPVRIRSQSPESFTAGFDLDELNKLVNVRRTLRLEQNLAEEEDDDDARMAITSDLRRFTQAGR